MDTNIESNQNNNFIYALGLICLLSILSSELKIDESTRIQVTPQVRVVSDRLSPSYYLI